MVAVGGDDDGVNRAVVQDMKRKAKTVYRTSI